MPPPANEQQILAVYRETIDALYGYVSRMCDGDRALAEDVTQEAWLRAVREWRRNGPPDRPIAWLSTVARNIVLNHARRPRPTPLDAIPPVEILAALENGRATRTADAGEDADERAALVRDAIGRLSERHARMLTAFYYDRHPVARIAETLGISERAAEGRLRRARQKLKRELEAAMETEGGWT